MDEGVNDMRSLFSNRVRSRVPRPGTSDSSRWADDIRTVSRLVVGLLIAAAAVLVQAGPVHAADDRLLFDNPHYDVFVPERFACGEPVTVTVRSAKPQLFQADSAELQRIVDAAQAVLRYRCPDLAGVKLVGRLAGLSEPVYIGVAAAHSNWALVTTRSIQSEELRIYRSPSEHGNRESADNVPSFTVANLSAGMSVEEARSAITDTFGVEPEYEAGRNRLTMQSGGCPPDYDWTALPPSPEPGWKCLQARFTEQRPARLYFLNLVQVIGPQDPQRVRQYLIDQFGQPAASSTRKLDRAWWQPEQTVYILSWGKRVRAVNPVDNGGRATTYTLQASILPTDDATVVAVTLYAPEVRPPSASGPQSPDLTL